jgi:hypothetical protein
MQQRRSRDFFTLFWQHWGLNSRLCTCKPNALLLESLYIHMYVNGRMKPVETMLDMGEKENDGRGEFN